jgi:hypothetical protein
MFKLAHISLVCNLKFAFLNASESGHCVLQMLGIFEWVQKKQKYPIIAIKMQNFSYFLNESKSWSHLLMHFCSPPFRLSKAPKRTAIPASGKSEKHVALHPVRYLKSTKTCLASDETTKWGPVQCLSFSRYKYTGFLDEAIISRRWWFPLQCHSDSRLWYYLAIFLAHYFHCFRASVLIRKAFFFSCNPRYHAK